MSEDADVTRLVVAPTQAGLRLDQLLAAATILSRRRARVLIDDGAVRRNGEATRVQSRTVAAGDVVDVLRPADELGVPSRPRLPEVELLWRDDWLAVAAKPAGLLSQPAERRAPDELACDEIVLMQLAVETGRRPFVRLVHRLDRLTSGTLLFALSDAALPPLAAAWREGRVLRVYLAVVEGRPEAPHLEITVPIERDANHSWRFRTRPTGRPARTTVYLLAEGAGWSLVACRLATGRTHQVRVHLAAADLPVVGDRLYGARGGGARRPLLHAAALALPHPRGDEELRVLAPPPADLASYLPPGWRCEALWEIPPG